MCLTRAAVVVALEHHIPPWFPTAMLNVRFGCFALLIACACRPLTGQHPHLSGSTARVTPPKVFLDKSPKIVEYQLKRLSNEQLLLVERNTTDPKYRPVYLALLTREGISRAQRDEALASLIALNKSDPVSELVAALKSLQGEESAAIRTRQVLGDLLLGLSAEQLAAQLPLLVELTGHSQPSLNAYGFAGVFAAGQAEAAWKLASAPPQLVQALSGLQRVPSVAVRDAQQPRVLQLLEDSQPVEVREEALRTLAKLTVQPEVTFERAAQLIVDPQLQTAAVRTLLSVPADARSANPSRTLIDWLVKFAEHTPTAERTTAAFMDAMELVDQLLATAPTELAKPYRQRLRETVVRVIRIHTIEEEMRYDLPYFAVEAGRPVQLVLINDDLMPHNLVVTVPGALQEVAEQGMEVGPSGGLDGKQYVPHSEKVLFATDMVPAREQAVLTFTAPTDPGEYPYVCTFPRHWMRMYGVMVVVDDLDAWQKQPVIPRDPIGSNRHFVQAWKVGDFQELLPAGLRGRTNRIGEKLFVEATCAQCHKLGEVGVGQVGPDLSSVFSRWQGDPAAVLREVLDPSQHIDDKYAVHIVLTVDGQTISGLIVEDSPQALSLLENPESKQPRVISKDDIDEMQKTANSMMPKGLLDSYSQDEVLEILAFIQAFQTAP